MISTKQKKVVIMVLLMLAVSFILLGTINFGFANQKDPIIITLDNTQAMNSFNHSNSYWNANKSIHQGNLLIESKNDSQEDGVQLEDDDLSGITGNFDLDEYPFMKVRMKRTNYNASRIQIYIGNGDRSIPFYDNNVNSGAWVDFIFDLSVNSTQTPAIFWKNEDAGTSGSMYYYSNKTELTDLVGGVDAYFRFNPLRGSTVHRTAEISYIGFFATKQQAEDYNGSAQERLDIAEQKMTTGAGLTLPYSQGVDVDNLEKNIKQLLNDKIGIDCTLTSYYNFVEPTVEKQGSIACSIDLYSGGQKRELQDVVINIECAPAPVMIRFNSMDVIKKLRDTGSILLSLEDGVMRMEQANPMEEDGFSITFNTGDITTPFEMSEYPIIKLKYKPMYSGGSYQLYHTYNGSPTGASRTYLANWDEGQWLEMILNMNKTENAIEIYNTETGVTSYQHFYNSSTWKPLSNVEQPFKGTADHFRFNLGRRYNLERVAYVEYISFFATEELARGYQDDWEKAKANASSTVQNEISTLSYAMGVTKDLAQESTLALIKKHLGSDYKITLNNVKYVQPGNKIDGTFSCSATITNEEIDDEFTINSISLRILANGKTLESELLSQVTASNLSVSYNDYKDQESAKQSAFDLINSNLPDGAVLEEITVTKFVAPTTDAKGSMILNATVSAGEGENYLDKSIDFTFEIAVIPNDVVDVKFDIVDGKVAVNTYLLWNATDATDSGDRYLLKTSEATMEDGFRVGFPLGQEINLQDYPYIKIRYVRTGNSGNNTGSCSLLIHPTNDTWYEHQNMIYEADFTLGSPNEMGKEMFAIISMIDETITLYNAETNQEVSKSAFASTLGEYKGSAGRVVLALGRHITVERTAYLDYVSFFTNEQDALNYNGDTVRSSINLDGSDYFVAKKAFANQPKTIEALVNLTDVNQNGGLIFGNDGFELSANKSGNLILTIGGSQLVAEINVITNKWEHVAVSMADGNAKIFLNGQVVKEGTYANAGNLNTVLKVGGKGINQFNVVGRIAELRVWDQLRTQQQIADNMFEIIDSKPMDAWVMDKLSAGSVFTNEYNAENQLAYLDVYGHLYHEFLGNDSLVLSSNLSKDVKTIELWVKGGKNRNNATLLSNNSIKLLVGSDGNLTINFATESVTTSGLDIYEGVWKHIAIVRNSNSITLYINGEVFNTWDIVATPTVAEKQAFTFGANVGGTDGFFTGYIGETRLWNSERTASEIKNNLAPYFTSQSNDLIALWKFEYSYAAKYLDEIGDNDATINAKKWYKTNIPNYDYTIAVIPDTQDNGVVNPNASYVVADYIMSQKESMNIIAAFAMGDHTQNNTEMEWKWIREAFGVFKNGIPYIPVAGNHDYPSLSGKGFEIRDGEMFNKYWSYEYLSTQDGVRFGGVFEKDSTQNYYAFISDGMQEYLVVATEFAPRDEVLEWVDMILKQNADKKAIIITHNALTKDGLLQGQDKDKDINNAYGAALTETTLSEPYDLWKKVVYANTNVCMVFGGHVGGVTAKQFENKIGEKVSYIVCDTSQTFSEHFSGLSGKGMFGLYRYNENGEATYYIYSPVYDAYYNSSLAFEFSVNI